MHVEFANSWRLIPCSTSTTENSCVFSSSIVLYLTCLRQVAEDPLPKARGSVYRLPAWLTSFALLHLSLLCPHSCGDRLRQRTCRTMLAQTDIHLILVLYAAQFHYHIQPRRPLPSRHSPLRRQRDVIRPRGLRLSTSLYFRTYLSSAFNSQAHGHNHWASRQGLKLCLRRRGGVLGGRKEIYEVAVGNLQVEVGMTVIGH